MDAGVQHSFLKEGKKVPTGRGELRKRDVYGSTCSMAATA